MCIICTVQNVNYIDAHKIQIFRVCCFFFLYIYIFNNILLALTRRKYCVRRDDQRTD